MGIISIERCIRPSYTGGFVQLVGTNLRKKVRIWKLKLMRTAEPEVNGTACNRICMRDGGFPFCCLCLLQ